MNEKDALQEAEMAVLRRYGLKLGNSSNNDLEAQEQEYRFQQSEAGKTVLNRLDQIAEKMRHVSGKKTPVKRLCPLIDAKTGTIERFFIQKGK